MVADGLDTQIFQTQITKAATFRGQGIALPGGTPRRGGTCRVVYTNATSTTTNSLQFSVGLSYDGGSTWTDEFWSDVIPLTTTAKSGEIYIPYRAIANVMATPQVIPQVALSINLSGAGTPSVQYQGANVSGGPA